MARTPPDVALRWQCILKGCEHTARGTTPFSHPFRMHSSLEWFSGGVEPCGSQPPVTSYDPFGMSTRKPESAIGRRRCFRVNVCRYFVRSLREMPMDACFGKWMRASDSGEQWSVADESGALRLCDVNGLTLGATPRANAVR